LILDKSVWVCLQIVTNIKTNSICTIENQDRKLTSLQLNYQVHKVHQLVCFTRHMALFHVTDCSETYITIWDK